MALRGSDLAILTARFGCARFGASRFGFIPCPEDVKGAGFVEPGEYIYREDPPPTTTWTLQNADCVCRNLCTLALGTITLSDSTPQEDQSITASVALTGVVGDVDGIARIDWGDGRHDQQDLSPLVNGTLQFTGHYHVSGSYTITIEVTDERGCSTTATLPVTVATTAPLVADFTIDVNGQGAEGGSGAETTGWTGDSTVSGGVTPYTYAWKVWNEYTSEASPLYTSTVADPNFPPPMATETCVGQAKLTVTDSALQQVIVTHPWNWNCV